MKTDNINPHTPYQRWFQGIPLDVHICDMDESGNIAVKNYVIHVSKRANTTHDGKNKAATLRILTSNFVAMVELNSIMGKYSHKKIF